MMVVFYGHLEPANHLLLLLAFVSYYANVISLKKISINAIPGKKMSLLCPQVLQQSRFSDFEKAVWIDQVD